MHIALYGPDFSLVAVSEGIETFFARWPELGETPQGGVPQALTAFVREQAERSRASGEDEMAALFLPTLMVQAAEALGPAGRLVTATFRPFAVRDPVGAAARRFKLTERERQVLALLVRGLSAAEVARDLEVSELTVGDYFKRLRAKTGARTQSGMIATLLGWTFQSSSRIDAEHAG